MKIAIAQSNLTLKGGGERVVLKIAQHYKAPIYVAEYDRANTFDEFRKLDVRLIPRRVFSRLPYGQGIPGAVLRTGLLQPRPAGRVRRDKCAHGAQPLDKEQERADTLVLPHAPKGHIRPLRVQDGAAKAPHEAALHPRGGRSKDDGPEGGEEDPVHPGQQPEHKGEDSEVLPEERREGARRRRRMQELLQQGRREVLPLPLEDIAEQEAGLRDRGVQALQQEGEGLQARDMRAGIEGQALLRLLPQGSRFGGERAR